MNEKPLLLQAARVLEWDRLVAVLAGCARSVMGAERCRSLAPETDLEAARMRLQETAEMVALGESSDPFPSLPFPDVRGALGRAVKGAMLETLELRDISVVLGLSAEVVRYLRRRQEQVPALCAVAAPLETMQALRHVKEAVDRCIDQEGNIRESATPELSRLTRHAHGLKETMRRRLEMILASSRYADALQERYFAEREGRYVIPIKAEMRGKIPGIVHDVSASGATVFLEPRELVELNNAIKVAELAVEREVHRLLQELSALVARYARELSEGLEALAELDAIAAKAALSRLIRGQAVTLNAQGRIALKQARHPLLVIAKEQVVPNDILLEEDVRVLVISGPNTGGKTVTLKLLGLFALMVRAGLQPSCGPGSEMAFFPEVYADIGDAQDLTKDLSSFSAHITQMIQLLEQMNGRNGVSESLLTDPPARALVLLDEPVTSTDPAEGAALAEALLLRLAGSGMKVVVTTHYQSLKALAQTTPGFMNASVGFDVGTLSPTYRLIMGIPGGSSAIEIAGRLGMDERILDQALELLNREDRAREARVMEQMLSDLQEKQRQLAEETAEIARLKAEAEREMREAAEIAERLRKTEREEQKKVKKKLTDELLRARSEVQAIVEGAKREQTLIKAKEAKHRLAEVEEQARERLLPQEAVPVEQLRAGDRIEIVSLGAIGTLLESPEGKKRVRVRVGETEMSVAKSLLVGIAGTGEGNAPARGGRQEASKRVAAASAEFMKDTPMILDVRGRTAEEALELTMASLDQAMLAGQPSLRIIHGHGTGRLKAALRAYLKESPYVASFRPGERAEGGDGVTIVELK